MLWTNITMAPDMNQPTTDLGELTQCLNRVGNFSANEIQQIANLGVMTHAAKNEVLLKPGQVANSVSFILQGACYEYRDSEEDEVVIELYVQHDCVVNTSSFIFQQPASEFVKTYTDCSIFTLSVHAIHQLIGLSPVYFQLGKVLQSTSFRLHFFDSDMTPQEKYQYLLAQKPALIQAFPLKLVASYLKITPETLSRVRAAR